MLKRRVSELEQQLQQREAESRRLSEQLQSAREGQQARAGEAAGAIERLEQQLTGVRLGERGWLTRKECSLCNEHEISPCVLLDAAFISRWYWHS